MEFCSNCMKYVESTTVGCPFCGKILYAYQPSTTAPYIREGEGH